MNRSSEEMPFLFEFMLISFSRAMSFVHSFTDGPFYAGSPKSNEIWGRALLVVLEEEAVADEEDLLTIPPNGLLSESLIS